MVILTPVYLCPGLAEGVLERAHLPGQRQDRGRDRQCAAGRRAQPRQARHRLPGFKLYHLPPSCFGFKYFSVL